MKNEPRRVLRSLIVKYGLDLCSDVKRCQGLLRDLCGAYPREINILTDALRERVPLDLLAGRNSMPHGLLMARLAKRVEDQSAMTEEAARWGVESWALALGIVTEDELEEAKNKRDAASHPPAPKAHDEHRPQANATRPLPQPYGTAPAPRRGSINTHQTAPGGLPAAVGQGTAPGMAQPSEPPVNYGPQRRGGFKLRGCVMGCLFLIILSALLFLAVPYVVSVLREEQQQRINEPSRVPPQ